MTGSPTLSASVARGSRGRRLPHRRPRRADGRLAHRHRALPPMYGGAGPYAETDGIASVLAAASRSGLVTSGSQPAYPWSPATRGAVAAARRGERLPRTHPARTAGPRRSCRSTPRRQTLPRVRPAPSVRSRPAWAPHRGCGERTTNRCPPAPAQRLDHLSRPDSSRRAHQQRASAFGVLNRQRHNPSTGVWRLVRAQLVGVSDVSDDHRRPEVLGHQPGQHGVRRRAPLEPGAWWSARRLLAAATQALAPVAKR